MKGQQPRVILINSLAEFMVEVPPPAVVRLNLTERQDSRKYGSGKLAHHLPIVHLNLNLQGVDAQGSVVWLYFGMELQQMPGRDGFWTPRDQSLNEQAPQMYDMVKVWLEGRGYEVRGGQFGLPQAIVPVRGVFECVSWRKEGDGYVVEAAVGGEA